MKLTPPTKEDIQVINWAGAPLAQWVAEGKSRNVNFWASEDNCWAFFARSCYVHGSKETCDFAHQCRINISYDEAGKLLAKM